MSEESIQTFEEKMAIPEGGEEDHMDVSSPEDSHIAGYVSINLKGPGKQIQIRPDEKLKLLSHGIEANNARPPLPDYNPRQVQADLEDRHRDPSEQFLDKKTGRTISLERGCHDKTPSESSSSRQISENNDTEVLEKTLQKVHTKLRNISVENELNNFPDYGFRSQAKVVSLCSSGSPVQAHVSDSPGKIKYKLNQAGAKKSIGSKKKTGQGKDDSGLPLVARGQPYPKWMKIPISDIFSGQSHIDIDGKKHLLKYSLEPVDNIPEELHNFAVQGDWSGPGIDPAVTGSLHAEGSIDRPPDSSFHGGNSHDEASDVFQTDAQLLSSNPKETGYVFPGCHYSGSATGLASAYDDQPLDLTVEKPLDLSMKGKPVTRQSQRSVSGSANEAPYSWSSMRAESNVCDYRYRCPSSLSVDDRDSVMGDESLDSGLASDLSQHCSEGSVNDGNLPSLGRLTLECKQQQACATLKSGVQDSSIKQEMVSATSGKQHILDLLNSRQISVQQLLALYYENQQKKSENPPHPTTPSTCPTGQTRQQLIETNQVSSQVDEPSTEEIPTPAMPNLQSLELADSEGGIFERENERLKSKLKAKVLGRNQP